MTRFDLPVPGAPSAVAFPGVERSALANGLRIWSIQHSALPVVSFTLVLDHGIASDPPDRLGLTSLVASLVAESAGPRDAIALADAVARLGAHLEVQAGGEITTVSLMTLVKHTRPALDLLADIVRRPQLTADDFARVRELRLNRLRQSSRVAGTMADRALISAVFGDHPYGHGSLGTTAAIEATTIDEVRTFWHRTWSPAGATLIAVGDLDAASVRSEAERVLGDWPAGAFLPVVAPAPISRPARDVIAVHRAGAAQAEVRVGQIGPSRRTPAYHALITLNALLGGQFTSRINRNLREARAITYGARSGFDMRRAGGLFSCDASVQSDAAAVAAAEIQREFREVAGDHAVTADELDQARTSLTRGYVRHFETPGQIARAAVELATYDLPDDTYDRFVPAVTQLSVDDIAAAARASLQPDDCAIVIVTDLDKHREALGQLGRPVTETTVEF
jgi:zinc protease